MPLKRKATIALSVIAIASAITLFASGPLIAAHQGQAFWGRGWGWWHRGWGWGWGWHRPW